MVTVGKVDILFVEDGGPLEGCGCLCISMQTWANSRIGEL